MKIERETQNAHQLSTEGWSETLINLHITLSSKNIKIKSFNI